jgi:hypothetical protein
MIPDFEEELKKISNYKILNFLHNIKGLSYEEISQLKRITVWKAVKTFKPEKNCLFTTHLYNTCRYTYLEEIRKKKEPNLVSCSDGVDKAYIPVKNPLEEIPEEIKSVLEDKYYQKMSIRQLMKKYKKTRKEMYSLIEECENYFRNNYEFER